jgi:hypothetical protein
MAFIPAMLVTLLSVSIGTRSDQSLTLMLNQVHSDDSHDKMNAHAATLEKQKELNTEGKAKG